jgi:hypothetical protein
VASGLKPGDAEALYAGPLEAFMAARTELVKRLKDAGDADAAKEAAALRKPTVAAWAVDQLARTKPKDLDALFRAGGRLKDAQQRAVAGGEAKPLQEAGRERRRIVERLAASAGGILEEAGMSSARSTIDKVADTLMAMATDEEAAERVRRGILERELPAPAGFGEGHDGLGLEAALAASVPPRKGKPTSKQRAARQRAQRLEAEADEAAAEASRLEREALEAERSAAGAAREAKRARKTAAEARRRAEQVRQRADKAGEA